MQQIKAILKDSRYNDYIIRTSKLEQERKFCKHSTQHFWDVARIGYILFLEKPSAYQELDTNNAKKLIYAAGLLHDIGRWCQYETGEDHALAGAELAVPILEDTNFSPLEIEMIKDAIVNHRKGGKRSLALLLYEADKLSRDCEYCSAISECNKVALMKKIHKERIY